MVNEIKDYIHENGIDYFGIGNLEKYSKELTSYGYPITEKYLKCISIGRILSKTIVDQLKKESKSPIIDMYRHFCYDLINLQIDNALLKISEIIIKNGYDALPIPASATTNKTNLYGTFSHKAAANLSGLGWIGKSCLLITEKNGPRVRWGTILINAPLTITGNPVSDKCKVCELCVIICPAKAFTGKTFDINDRREVRYNAHKCDKYLSKMNKEKGLRVCGLCVQVCPYGRKESTNAK